MFKNKIDLTSYPRDVYVTADTHFEHKRMIERDGLRSHLLTMERHDKEIKQYINSQVKPNDLLIHLGDFAFYNLTQHRNDIKCRKIWLCMGNHDYYNSRKELLANFERIYHTMMVKVWEKSYWMSHYPHFSWPQKKHGAIHLFAHMHGTLTADIMKSAGVTNAYDVGLDATGFSCVKIK